MTETNTQDIEKEIKTINKNHEEPESIGEIIKTVLFALGIALFLRIFIFQPFTIPSESMRPGLEVGDYLFVSKWDYGISNASIPFEPKIIKGRLFNQPLKRGDVVVFKLPKDGKTDYIKRVIGLPGDRIQIIGGQIILNGVPIERKALPPKVIMNNLGETLSTNQWEETLPEGKKILVYDFYEAGQFDNTKVYEVPVGHYFMMGDNRDNSLDSRADPDLESGVGYVPEENIVGKARIVLISWDENVKLIKPWTWFTAVKTERLAKPIK